MEVVGNYHRFKRDVKSALKFRSELRLVATSATINRSLYVESCYVFFGGDSY